MERIFRPSWQIVCHDSDIPNVGDWHSIDTCGESVIVVRGTDCNVRAFTNVCRHRGSRLVDGAAGCAKKLVCPYHRSEEHTSELQSLMRISYAVFCLKKQTNTY